MEEPDETSAIVTITQDGKPVGNRILGDTYPLNVIMLIGFAIALDSILIL